mgnify:FL=1
MENKIEIRAPLVIAALGSLLLVILVWTSFYTVQAESQGVVLRFGKYVKTVEPGLRLKLPFGIDEVSILPVRRQLKKEFGFGKQGGTKAKQI